jgi:release factor glutamine methyltransferase
LRRGYKHRVWLFRPPGVYRPQADTGLLAEALRAARVGVKVLDVGTGTGALALEAALSGAAEVVAVDDCARAVFAARVNVWLRRLPIQVFRSDLFEAVAGQVFDVIVANPPYVCSDGFRGTRGPAHMWDGGPSGRAVLDRLCCAVPSLLAPDGTLLLVQSALCGVQETICRLREEGLDAAEIARRQEAFGPVMSAHAGWLEDRGLIGPGQRYEDLVVIRACHVQR